MGEHIAAVCIQSVDRTTLCTNVGQCEIDQCHECRAERAGDNRAVRDRARLRQSESLDGTHKDVAESERGKHIHRIVALEESCEEGVLRVCTDRLRIPNRPHW